MGDDRGGGTDSQDGVESRCTVGESVSVIFHLHHKTQQTAYHSKYVGYYPMGTPTCLRKQEVENPARPQHNPLLKQRAMRIPGLINCRKAGISGRYLEC